MPSAIAQHHAEWRRLIYLRRFDSSRPGTRDPREAERRASARAVNTVMTATY